MRQVFDNCRLYNAPDQEVVVMGNTLEVSRWGLLCTPVRCLLIARSSGVGRACSWCEKRRMLSAVT